MGIANFYIADTHIGDEKIIDFDSRPFSSIEEMNKTIVENWNKTVSDNDRVYILGDFIYGKEDVWLNLVPKLSGKKFLIKGNHDLKQISGKLRGEFANVCEYLEVEDGNKTVVLSHYPIIFYRHDNFEDVVMLYGHVHNSKEYDDICNVKEYIKRNKVSENHAKFINVGCMMPWINYTPQTLNYILQNQNKRVIKREKSEPTK